MNAMENPPVWLDENDFCLYAREYTPNAGYQESQTNDLILNFKKSVERRGKREWQYKEEAIHRFASELSVIIGNEEFIVAPIPCSMCSNDPLYDPRLDQTLSLLKSQYNNQLEIIHPIIRKETVPAKHASTGRRNPSLDLQSLEWVGSEAEETPELIVLIDDVITTGSTFKACKTLIQSNIQNCKVAGIFWARSVWRY